MPLSEDFIRGAVGVIDRQAEAHPEEYKRAIKMIELKAGPITMLTKQNGKRKVKSRKFHWSVQPFPQGRGDVTGVYTNAALSAAYASGAIAGTQLYFKMSEAHAKQIIAGDCLTLIYATTTSFFRGFVTAVSINGASSYVLVRMFDADAGGTLSNTNAGNNLIDFTISGHAQEEYAGLPDPLFSQPTWFDNYCEIFAESSELTDREQIELDRNDPGVRARSLKQAYQRMMSKAEKAILFGKKTSFTGSDNKEMTFMDGLLTVLEANEPNNIFDYTSDSHALIGSKYNGKTWLQNGLDFLEEIGEYTSQYGEAPWKTCWIGSSAWRYISQAAREKGTINMTTTTTKWGIIIRELNMPRQNWRLIEHPYFSLDPNLKTTMLVTEKHLMRQAELQPLKVIGGKSNEDDGRIWESGIKEGWVHDWGLEYENLSAFAFIKNIGSDNP